MFYACVGCLSRQILDVILASVSSLDPSDRAYPRQRNKILHNEVLIGDIAIVRRRGRGCRGAGHASPLCPAGRWNCGK